MDLPGIPKPDVAAAARAALAEPLFALGLAHAPDQVLRELQQIIIEVRRRWPEDRRPAPVGVRRDDEPPPPNFVATPPLIAAHADQMVRLLADAIATHGPLTHKSVILHMTIVQAINAVMRHCDGVSPQGFYDGLANGVAQMLAIAPAENNAAAEFLKSFDVAFEYWRTAGQGAGVDFNKPQGSA